MKKLKLIILLLFGLFASATAQDKAFKNIFMDAEYYRLTENYSKALSYYENLLMKDPDNYNLQFLCGYCCLKCNADIEKTISYLEEAVGNISSSYKEGSYKERNAPPEAYFALARIFHINKDFNRAMDYYEKYRSTLDDRKFADIEYVNNFIKSCELGQAMVSNPVNIKFSKVSNTIPSTYPADNPVVSGNDSVMIFSYNRPAGKTIMMTVTQEKGWSEPKMLNHELGLTGNAYPVSLSFDGTELYLVYADYFESDIYVSHYMNNKWSEAMKLNKEINTRYYESHACITGDGRWLYFTSDRTGGQGGLDIYRSERISGNEWGKAENLGPDINTYYNEETPFLTKNDSRLYFSSQGHSTMGGYDIFYSDRKEDGGWIVPKNIGHPLNTGDDDLFYNPGWHDQLAYYATRIDSLSDTPAIYSVRIIPFQDLEIGMVIANLEESQELTGSESSNVSGNSGASFASLGIYYIMNNIFFDYDDYNLNEKAIRDVERIYYLMRKYPEIEIGLTGHTDARGSAEYNRQLSERRAGSVARYLTEKGIDTDRISISAGGESDPIAINEYEDGSDAPEGRRLNRHVSVKVTNLKYEKIRIADIFVPDKLIPKQDLGYSVLLTNSNTIIDTMPEKVLDEEVSLIFSGQGYFYSAGQFDHKAEATRYLNEILDMGFDDAQMVEKRKLERMIQDNSGEDPFVPMTFTIQVMALKNPRDVSFFRNLDNVKRIEGKDGLYRYICGEYKNIEDALRMLPGILKKGYEDAFIMPASRYIEISGKD